MANKINSRSKGNRFERNTAKWLSEWTGYEFGRVPGSGSLRWKKTDNITGDITCTDDKHARRFPFSVECKNHKDIRFEHVLLQTKSCKIHEFWSQATNDASRANKIPLLIMRYNSMPKSEFFLMVPEPIGKEIMKQKPTKPHVKLYMISQTVYIFMASDIKNMEYTPIYKVARLLTKTLKK